MASSEIRDFRAVAGSLLLLAATVLATCLAQASLESSADRQREIIERIEQEQARNGPHSEALVGPLTGLALRYQEEGDHLLAAATIERVRQVVRVNYGLHSLEQAPLIQQLITTMEAMGDVEAAWKLEQELLALARRHPDDLRTVPIFREAADSRTAVLRRFLSGEFPSQIILGCYYDFEKQEDCNSGMMGRAVRALSLDAQRHYADAITVMLRNEQYSSDELRELEASVVRNADRVRQYEKGRLRRHAVAPTNLVQYFSTERERLSTLTPTVPVGGSNYLMGRMSLERLVAYEYLVASGDEAPPEAWVNLAAAVARVADWDLLHSVNGPALEGYELAYTMLEAAAAARSSIDELFSPATPVVLPTLSPSPLSSSAGTERLAGYVDVAFEITRYGEGRRIEVLDATTSARDASGIVRMVKASVFRPRVVDGRFDTSRVTARYHLEP